MAGTGVVNVAYTIVQSNSRSDAHGTTSEAHPEAAKTTTTACLCVRRDDQQNCQTGYDAHS